MRNLGLILPLLGWLSGCATYLGYHYEYEEGPKTTKVVSRSIDDLSLNVLEKPSANNPEILIAVKGTEKTSKETTFDKKTFRMDRYLPYDASYDICIEIMAFPFFGGFDLLFRLLGDPGVSTVSSDEPEQGRSAVKYDKNKPDSWYWKNLGNWFGWFLPGFNAFHEIQKYEYEKTLASTTLEKQSSEEKQEVGLAGARLLVDLGPAGATLAMTDPSGVGHLDLRPYLPKLKMGDAWQISAMLKDNPKAPSARVLLNANDLGVTWVASAAGGEKEAFDAALASGEGALKDFIRQRPNGPYTPQARHELARIAREKEDTDFEAAKRAGTVEALLKFLKEHEGVHVEEISALISKKQTEEADQAYQAAVRQARATRDATPLDEIKRKYRLSPDRMEEIRRIQWELLPKVRITGNVAVPSDIPILEAPKLDAPTVIEKAQPGARYLYKKELNQFYAVELSDGRIGYVYKGLAKRE